MTFTVAWRAGELLGLATASAWPGVGGGTLGATPGRVVAVQGAGDAGLAAAVARGDRAVDDLADDQQLVLLDGRQQLAHTGSACWPATSAATTDRGAAATNCSAAPDVADRMLDAVARTEGDLVTRLVTGLDAGHRAGGDARGTNSAACVLSDGDRVEEYRVDWSADPLADLAAAVAATTTLTALFTGTADVADVERAATSSVAVVRFWAHAAAVRRGLDLDVPAPTDPWSTRALARLRDAT